MFELRNILVNLFIKIIPNLDIMSINLDMITNLKQIVGFPVGVYLLHAVLYVVMTSIFGSFKHIFNGLLGVARSNGIACLLAIIVFSLLRYLILRRPFSILKNKLAVVIFFVLTVNFSAMLLGDEFPLFNIYKVFEQEGGFYLSISNLLSNLSIVISAAIATAVQNSTHKFQPGLDPVSKFAKQ